jgi:hypothetical protein
VPALRVFAILAAVGVLALSTTPVQGQVPDLSQSSSEKPTHSSQLPDWAEPASPESGSNFSTEHRASSRGSGPGELRTKAPPPGGEPIPVDGGLALLAAAGAGYAVRRLNQGDNEFEE